MSSGRPDLMIFKKNYIGNECFLHRGFSKTETLCSEYKYYCEQCRSKQEAQKRWVRSAGSTVPDLKIFLHLEC